MRTFPLLKFCERLLFLVLIVGASASHDALADPCTMPTFTILLTQAKAHARLPEPLRNLTDASPPQTHTMITRDGRQTGQWVGLQWDSPPRGALFLLDGAGHILDVINAGAVETIQQGPTLGAAGETALVTAITNTSGYRLEEIDLLGRKGGHIHLLWSHAKEENIPALQTELLSEDGVNDVYTWSFEEGGTVIRVSGRRSTFPPPTRDRKGNEPPPVEDLPADRYCWSSSLARYVGCNAFAPAEPGSLATPAQVATSPTKVAMAELDATVIARLTSLGLKQPVITAHLDLTEPFGTVSKWTLVIAQDKQPPPQDEQASEVDHGPVTVCFVKDLVPECSESFYPHVTGDFRWFDTPFDVFDSRVVHAGAANTVPMLLLKLCGFPSGDGNCHQVMALYRYNRSGNSFRRVFLNLLDGSNMNEGTRFVESGPLRGDVIVDDPAGDAPYTYWIEVYRPGPSGRYVRVLHYRGRTGYGDGNSLAVADSEMPEILRRLGLWKAGDPLPVPMFSGAYQQCYHPVMRKREEWCE